MCLHIKQDRSIISYEQHQQCHLCMQDQLRNITLSSICLSAAGETTFWFHPTLTPDIHLWNLVKSIHDKEHYCINAFTIKASCHILKVCWWESKKIDKTQLFYLKIFKMTPHALNTKYINFKNYSNIWETLFCWLWHMIVYQLQYSCELF